MQMTGNPKMCRGVSHGECLEWEKMMEILSLMKDSAFTLNNKVLRTLRQSPTDPD